MRAGQEAGHQVNFDNNDGNPEGISIAQFNVDNGARVTSTTAFLDKTTRSSLKNLVVVTKTLVSKLMTEDGRITGVQTIPTSKTGINVPIVILARREVILTAGCFQSPQLLLLSGIGPAEDLEAIGIPVVHDLQAVGQNLQDHSSLTCEFLIEPSIKGHNQLLNDPVALEYAIKQYQSTNDGPLSVFGASAATIFPKIPRLSESDEYAKLPMITKEFLNAKNRPSTEIWMHSGPLFYTGPCLPDASVLVIQGLCQNNLSQGYLKLATKNPRDLPLINPGYLTHPYDVEIAKETVREILKLAKTATFSSIIQSTLLGPRSPTDPSELPSVTGEDDKIIEDFVRDTLTQGFHSMSTCIMGRPSDRNKVVGPNFQVDGLKGLRIADMSVCPILTSNHTQINAYLIGERCAELVIEDNGRERTRNGSKL